MPESRLPHHQSHPHPSHGQPPYPSPYPPSQHAPAYHHSSRHVSNGPPPPVIVGGHNGHPAHGHPMAAPPDPVGPPPPPQMGNGHGPHHGPRPTDVGPPISAAARAGKEKQENVLSQLASANENTWMLIGAVAEQMQDQDRAMAAFENALRHNPNSILGLNAVASIARSRDNFDKAIEYFQRILNIKQDNGEVWGSMGHCLLMKDDLPKAYTAYQQALYHLPNPKEPKLWYGIGILYDRYGSFEHAEEAFSSVLRMDPNFEKANEIYFRLGIIYKHQRKYQASLECFKYILQDPPRPLTSWDIWFQLGHVYEQDRDYENARDAYMRVLAHQPDHAKVLQQLGWLHHQPGAPFADQEKAVQYLTKSLETDGSDAQSWYLLGRAFMAGQRYNKAYEAYQQAVYRDGRNPTFWCSIGVLYFQINQYRDALDAYSRAIRLNPYISEVWYNLGSLYESCNNQITDAIDAYNRAADLDPTNATIKQRLGMLQNAGGSNQNLPPAPGPVDVHPSQYTAQPQGAYPPGGSPGGSPRPIQMAPPGGEIDGPNGRALPPPPPGGDMGRGHSPGPFRGGAAPPPLQHVDESRGVMSRHAPLAPMETDGPLREQRPDAYRFDPAADARRHGSPGSPRRREHYPPPQGYPGYGRDVRDREREEWERRNSRPPPGPSPRMHDRMVQPPGRQPSPRHPNEYGYGYPPDPRAGYPHERREPSNGANGSHYGPPGAGTPRHPSGQYDDPRAPSPAPSSIASVSGSRRKRDDDQPRSVKKERVVSKKSSGDKKTTLKPSHKQGAGDEASPKGEVSPPVLTSTPREYPAPPVPSRAVDEDYDEGAADALMTLHGDRPPSVAPRAEDSPPAVTGSKRPASPTSPGNSKKARPEAVARLSASTAPGRNGSASPARRQVIEVLNTPSISSPIPRPTSTMGDKDTPAQEDKQANREDIPAAAPVQPERAVEADKADSNSQPDVEKTSAKQVEGDVEMKDDQAPEALASTAAEVAEPTAKASGEASPAPAESSGATVAAKVAEPAAEKSGDKAAEVEKEAEAAPAPAVDAAESEAPATESAAPADAQKSDGDVVMEEAPVAPVAEPKEEAAATKTDPKAAQTVQENAADQAPEAESTKSAETSKPEGKTAEKEEGEV